MNFDKQQLQDRIILLNNELVQCKANSTKLEGHLAEAKHWLVELIKKEAEEQISLDKEELASLNNECQEEQPQEYN